MERTDLMCLSKRVERRREIVEAVGEEVREVGLVGRGSDVVDEGINCFVAKAEGKDWMVESCGWNSGSSSMILKGCAPPQLAGAVTGSVSSSAAKAVDSEALLPGTNRDRERVRLLERVVLDRRRVTVAVLFSNL